jgi:hypothetical protein
LAVPLENDGYVNQYRVAKRSLVHQGVEWLYW